jgi:hypothetical protein
MGGLHTTWPFPFALVLARALLLVLLCSECSATNVCTGEAVSELHASPGSHPVRESQRAVACVHAPIASHVVGDGDVLHQGASPPVAAPAAFASLAVMMMMTVL